MKLNNLILFIYCFVIFTSCKKDSKNIPSSDHGASDLQNNSHFSSSLTNQELKILNEILAKQEIKGDADFQKKVDSVKSLRVVSNTRNKLATVSNSLNDATGYQPATDRINDATSVQSYPNILVDPEFLETRTVYSVFKTDHNFPIRGNSMRIVVPYQYKFKKHSAGTNQIVSLEAYTPIQMLPVGGAWGEFTPGMSYFNNSRGINPFGQNWNISVYANGAEKRTIIRSTTGEVKISTNAKVEAFQVGTELGTGFTIQSASNIYNQYSMSATGQIQIEALSPSNNQAPRTVFLGTVIASDYGILKNY